MQKFIHITDTHFVPPGNLLYGLNPLDRFAMCVADVNRNHADAAFAVITGDLAHKGQPEALSLLRTTSGNIDDEVRRGSTSLQSYRTAEQDE
jgi:3',5'-cyclic-AMP phosphodiesterase